MKKIASPFICSLLFILSSCSSDKLTLDKTSLSLYAEDTEQLTANENVDWSTENEFVASVDEDGLVEANHVGRTYIVASSKNGEERCRVTVKAEYNTYTEPLFDFGKSMADIKKKEKRTVALETETSLGFTPKESALEAIMYLFEDGKMTSSGAFVKLSRAVEATYFLLERYLVVGVDQQNIDIAMINNIPSKATVGIAVSVQKDYCLVLYLPFTLTRSESERENYINELTEKYINLLNEQQLK